MALCSPHASRIVAEREFGVADVDSTFDQSTAAAAVSIAVLCKIGGFVFSAEVDTRTEEPGRRFLEAFTSYALRVVPARAVIKFERLSGR